MSYIKVILLINIGLAFSNEIISDYSDEEIENPSRKIEYRNEENTRDAFDNNIPDEYLDKNIINLPDNYYPTYYRVHLTVDTKSFYPTISVRGQVNINIIIVPNNMIQTLLLHAKNIQLDHFHTTLSNRKGIYFVNKSYTIQTEFLAIKFMSKIPPDNYTLKIVFYSTANSGFIRNKLPDKQTLFEQKNDLILMKFQKTAARHLFPCWDDPAYKTTFDIEITHENGYTVLSNTPVLENYDADDSDLANMKYTKFTTTPMMSTHQLMILLKPFDLLTDPSETVHTWYKYNKTSIVSFIHSTVDNMSKLLLDYTKIPLNNQKINHVVTPNVSYSKAELGLIIYRESDVIYNESEDPISVKSKVKNTIELQVAHQWFGGLVTPKFWNHSWLTESFALYLTHYFPRQAELWKSDQPWNSVHFDKALQLKIAQKYQDLLRKDVGSMPPVLFEILSLKPTSDVYHKGAFILRMLSSIISEQYFRKFVIDYLNRHKYGLVTLDDLWSTLQTVIESNEFLKTSTFSKYYYNAEKAPYSYNPLDLLYRQQLNVKKIIEPWITQKGFPIVEVSIYENGEELSCLQSSSSGDYSKWWIPVTYFTEKNDANIGSVFWLEPKNFLHIKGNWNDSWIIINFGQTGYYRVRYPRENWEKLGDFLNYQNYSKIPAINRAQLIDDICDEYRNKRTDWDIFSLVTSYLSRETDYIPWVSMLKCLDMLAEFFQFPESEQYQVNIGNYFTLILSKIGYEENPKDDDNDDYDEDDPNDDIKKEVRQNLTFSACTLGNPTCRSVAADKLKKYLADPTTYKILPQWESWTFCFGLKTENVSIWNQVYHLYAETKKRTILNSLSCTENFTIIINLLHTIVENNTLIEEADQADLFNTIIKRHIGNNQIFSHIKNNIKILKPKSIPLTDALDTIITNIYSKEQLDQYYRVIVTLLDDYNEYEARKNIIERQQEKIRNLKDKIDIMFPNKTIYYM